MFSDYEKMLPEFWSALFCTYATSIEKKIPSYKNSCYSLKWLFICKLVLTLDVNYICQHLGFYSLILEII